MIFNRNLVFKNFSGMLIEQKKHFKNLSLYLLSAIITSILGILINPFLAANLSPFDYAIIGYFTSFNLLVLPIISFSFISYYSRNYFKILENERKKVLDTLLISQFFVGLFGLVLILIGFHLYIDIARVKFPFYPFAILCFVPTFFSCFYNFLLIQERMNRNSSSYFKIVLINAILGIFFAIIFVVVLKNGAKGRLWGILIPTVGMGIYSFFRLLSKFQFSRKIFFEAVSFGWPVSLSAILYYFLTGVDRAMLEKLSDTNTFGIYNVAVQISAYLYIFYAALSQTFEPDIYKSIADNNRIRLIKIITGIVILNAIPTFIFIVLAYPIVKVLTYGRYIESTHFAQIIAFKNIPMALCFLTSNVIIGYGYPKVELINRIVGALISLMLFKIVIKEYGFYGAAWGQSIVFFIMLMISGFFVLYKILKIKSIDTK